MRRTQLLGLFLMLLAMVAMAAAAGPQLTAVSVNTQDSTTIITIRASGPFTHTEYRPADNLLLVDLPGVSAGVLDGQNQSVQGPGVAAYRVQSFKGSSGTDVARVELTLASAPFVTFNQDKDSLEVRVTAMGSQASAAPSAAPVAAPPASQVVATPTPVETVDVTRHQPARVSGPALVRSVNVVQGAQGLEVNIHSNGLLKPTVQRAQNPERLVIDLENARTLRPVQVPVKSDDVKDVRMAMHQANPPVTRVVVDLESAKDYELVPSETGLRVKLHAPAQVASLGAPPVAPAAPQMAALPVAALVNASASTSAPAAPALDTTNAAAAPQMTAPPVAAPVNASASTAVPSAPAPETTSVADAPQTTAPPVAAPANASTSTAVPFAPALDTTNAAAVPQTTAPSVAAPVNASPSTAAPSAPAPKTTAVAAATSAASAQPPKPAQDFVMVQPEFKPKAQADPTARAADAASKFSDGKTEIALASTPALAANAALHAAAPVTASVPQAVPAPQPVPTGKPKYTGEPISVNLKDVDLKDFFRLIHEISGLNVVLDPNVRGTLTLVLDDVPWDQALDIVLKNNGLERQLDGNVLRIATVDTLKREADGRRAQVEAQAMASQRVPVTRFLSYAHSKDLVPIVKKFLTKRGEVVSDDRNNAIIIMDIPDVFPEIDRLLTQLDRKTPEVEIEARVVAATRNFARDIGTQFGFAWGNGKSTAVGGASAVGTSPIVVASPTPPPFITAGGGSSSGSGSGSGGTSIPLFSNLPAVGATSGISLINLGSNYRLDFILTAAEQRGLLKVLSRPRVITQNNIQAVVRQGVRIPVVTQAQLQGPPTTTYIDAFLRLTVTPQITVENTIFLNVDVENTTPDFSQQVNGNPTLHTQQALTQVLVTDGGTVVIGGVIATDNSVSIQQVPLLGSIPALGNLFKRRFVTTETQELLFFITPKIVQT